MTDIATRWNIDRSLGDWSIHAPSAVSWTDEAGNAIVDEHGQPIDSVVTTGGILAADDELFTAALISIFTDAAAGADDQLPTGEEDPRGWWAGPIGSKIWLRLRRRPDELTRALDG
jgi:phage gp46-like protein